MIIIGADHTGFELKDKIRNFLEKQHLSYKDLSTVYDPEDDYPDIAKIVGQNVKKNDKNIGILICGSGVGMDIAANRIKGIRAALVYDAYTAKMSRSHNNANIICFRARRFSPKKALKILKIFLNTPFASEQRHIRRIKKLEKIK